LKQNHKHLKKSTLCFLDEEQEKKEEEEEYDDKDRCGEKFPHF